MTTKFTHKKRGGLVDVVVHLPRSYHKAAAIFAQRDGVTLQEWVVAALDRHVGATRAGNSLLEALKRTATPRNRRAMPALERLGLRFCVHFGTESAADHLEAIERARKQHRLRKHLLEAYGIKHGRGAKAEGR